MEEPILLTAEKQTDIETGYRCRLVLGNRENFIFHCHDYYEIFITLSDAVEHNVNGKKVILKRGDLVFIRPNDKHLYSFKGTNFTFINFAFDTETYNLLKNYLKTNKFLILESLEYPPVVNISETEIEWVLSGITKINQIDVDNNDGKRTEFRIFLLKIFSKFFLNNNFEEIFKSDIPYWISHFYNISQQIAVFSLPYSEFVAKSGKSREHLMRCFKKAYGISVSEFQHQLRLNYVANMLVSSSKKIIDIFLEAGYEDVSWASVLFKKKFGKSPSLYRKERTQQSLGHLENI